jgi:hypothetical protein
MNEETIRTIALKERDNIKFGIISQRQLRDKYLISAHMATAIYHVAKLGRLDGDPVTERELGKANSNVVPDRLVVTAKGNVLVIGDTHIPFQHPEYLAFCLKVKSDYQCETVVHIGDEVDNHAISFHDADPDGLSAGAEAEAAQQELNLWYEAFPEVWCIVGNHGALPFRKAYAKGIPKKYLKTYEEIWQAPSGWVWAHSVVIDNVLYEHGIGSSGKNAALNRAIDNRMSLVMGHAHSWGGVQYTANVNSMIFGMNVGCGIDINAYAMAYGKPFTKKPTLGCGVVMQGGKQAVFVPML